MTPGEFVAKHGFEPRRVMSRDCGMVWAIPARRVGMGYERHYYIRSQYRARAWGKTLDELDSELSRES